MRQKICLLLALIGSFFEAHVGFAASVDFAKEIRPILAEHCFHCHGPDANARKAGLRLDSREFAILPAESGERAIVPGSLESSQIVRRITSADESTLMPPTDHKKPLTPIQIELLKTWIAEGAYYSNHWAFETPKDVAPPATPPDVEEHPIDRWIGAKLIENQLRRSPPADPYQLCRRLYLDLLGVPPSPIESRQFALEAEKDLSEAVRSLAAKLLDRPQFGEKWARHWLDVARYADSDGYEKDLPRQQWAWRDWVINAINQDMPYDQFLIEQIAGDLLPNATQDQKVATGFLRNSMVSEEGAIIYEQYRMAGITDRMDCVGKAVLGLSLQCSQCHSHKFDPISQTEYYQLLSFINNDYEYVDWVYSPEQQAVIDDIRREVKNTIERVEQTNPQWLTDFCSWKNSLLKKAPKWARLKPESPEWIGGLAHPEVLPDDSVLTLGFRPTSGELILTSTTNQTDLRGLRLEALTHGDLPFEGPGRNRTGMFAVSELAIEVAPANQEKPDWKPIQFGEATTDGVVVERPIEESYKQKPDDGRMVGPGSYLFDGKEETAWAPNRGPGRRNSDYEVVVAFAEPVGFPEGTKFRFTFKYRHGGKDIHGRDNNFLGRFRLSVTSNPEPKSLGVPLAVQRELEGHCDCATDAPSLAMESWIEQTGDESLKEPLRLAWAKFPEAKTSILRLAQRIPEHARVTKLLHRGEWDQPKDPVAPGFLSSLHGSDGPVEPSRLSLAKWLASRNSPLTARVAVNRVWQAIMGVGLVDTPEDFGTRGSIPTHPELLDHLAVKFMAEGWSLKSLVAYVVTSKTYQQTSNVSPELIEMDPRNRLLSRGPRFRPDAEVVRDIVLSTSGLLNPTVGGPSIFPPVPESLLATSYLKVDFWETAQGADRYRRSLYVFRRRSLPDPALSCFDAPSGEQSCPKRNRSNTPLAALAGLNDPVFTEAARAMALRVLREGGSNDRERASYAMQLCAGRPARENEIEAIVKLIESRRLRIAEGWISPWAVGSGEFTKSPSLPSGVSPTEVACWTIASRVLLNLDETLTKN